MTETATAKSIFIIAGPNGAGKTTFARSFLPIAMTRVVFINADDIARNIRPDDVEAVALSAGRKTLEMIDAFVVSGSSFAFETTLSGLTYRNKILQWRNAGYDVYLSFLSLPNPEAAVKRVAIRVSQGGHNIPEVVIRRRFKAGIQNFHTIYKSLVTGWVLYDNSGNDPVILENG
jgi:predicted ABC-type ATPase